MSLSLNNFNNEQPSSRREARELERSSTDPGKGIVRKNVVGRPGTGLAAFNSPDQISAMFDDSDEMDAIRRAKESGSLSAFEEEYDPGTEEATQKLLENSLKLHREKYTGMKAARFITADILLEAPRGYFRKYDKDVIAGVDWIRKQLADREQSGVIAEARNAPMDEALQEEAYNMVNATTREYMERLFIRGVEREVVKTLILNEMVGFGRIDPLWRDRKIDEIAINGPQDIQVQIGGKRIRVPGCEFLDERHIMALLERIFSAVNRTISKQNPMVKGRLHDNSRIFATHSSVSPDGPNVLIRRHPEEFWTPHDLIDNDSASEELLAYLGNLFYKGCSIAVIGAAGTGKTTFLNALTGFYRDDARILTLEDNIEMLPNPKKMIAAAMECLPADPDGRGGVTMRDLVKGSLQMSPDVLVVGEVTDSAAMDLVQALNTGHYGASTVHANTPEAGMHRIASLVSQSGEATLESALPLIATAFDVVVQLRRFPSDGSRKIVSVNEVGMNPVHDHTSGTQYLPAHPLWEYRTEGIDRNDGTVHGTWVQVGEISQERAESKSLGLERDLTWEELSELSRIPEHLKSNT